ncbi:MAG TPA: signal peptidase II [Candidatus Cryosericum sp.]|nr:signal peptidase II [Candidatus Cryosericum sp.]
MLELIIIVLILALDQVSKYLIQIYLSPVGTSLPLIDGVFHLTNAHNTGAAWGMMQGFRWVFIPVTLIVGGLILYLLFKNRKNLTIFSRITLSLLFAGAVGNLIDRAILGYVRDFFDFCLINFPVFNVADSSLSVGCVLLVIDALFLKDRSLFERISFKKSSAPDKPAKKENA